MKKSLLILLLFASHFVAAQTKVNHYQYVIVPAKFDFVSEPDQYRLNTLTKLLFEKYGFKVFFDTDTLPKAIVDSKCDKLYANVISFGSFMMTKMKVQLKDCSNNLIYESGIGKSKEKEYRITYTKSLREAFQSFDSLNYHYAPVEKAFIQEIQIPKTETVIMSETFNEAAMVLYAQPITNGYQLVDATPKVVMKIFKTSSPNTYTAIKGNVQGVLILKDNAWFFENYQNDQLVSEKVNVKF